MHPDEAGRDLPIRRDPGWLVVAQGRSASRCRAAPRAAPAPRRASFATTPDTRRKTWSNDHEQRQQCGRRAAERSEWRDGRAVTSPSMHTAFCGPAAGLEDDRRGEPAGAALAALHWGSMGQGCESTGVDTHKAHRPAVAPRCTTNIGYDAPLSESTFTRPPSPRPGCAKRCSPCRTTGGSPARSFRSC